MASCHTPLRGKEGNEGTCGCEGAGHIVERTKWKQEWKQALGKRYALPMKLPPWIPQGGAQNGNKPSARQKACAANEVAALDTQGVIEWKQAECTVQGMRCQ